MTDFIPQNIALTLITQYPRWYRGKLRSIKNTDKIRGDLAIETIKIAQEKGYSVIVADGKSAKTFRRELEKIKNITLIRKRSGHRLEAKITTIKKAIKNNIVKAIVVSEAEKISLATDCLEIICKPLIDGIADIVVPKRNEEMFKNSYPDYQYESEKEGNLIYNEVLKTQKLLPSSYENLDVFFGPVAFVNKSNVTALFTRYMTYDPIDVSHHKHYVHTDQYSSFSLVLALKKHFSVISVEVPFEYPSLQKKNEEKGPRELFIEKRKNQRLSILVELLHFINYIRRFR